MIAASTALIPDGGITAAGCWVWVPRTYRPSSVLRALLTGVVAPASEERPPHPDGLVVGDKTTSRPAPALGERELGDQS